MEKIIDMPYDTDSELQEFKFTIPDDCIAEIKDNQVIIKRKQPNNDVIKHCIGLVLLDAPETRFKYYNLTKEECLHWLGWLGQSDDFNPQRGDIVTNEDGVISVFDSWGYNSYKNNYTNESYFIARLSLDGNKCYNTNFPSANGLRYATKEEIRKLILYCDYKN